MTMKEPVFKILLRNVIIECNKRGVVGLWNI